jgi:hypothetical protein
MTDRAARRTVTAAVAAILTGASAAAAAHDGDHKDAITLTPIATYDAGGVGSAEIVAHDAASQRLFVVNAATSTIDILDMRKPWKPVRVGQLDTSAMGSPNSVAARDGVVAVAIQSAVKTDPGVVAFYYFSGEFLSAVRVGALPDMLTFTPDGRHVLVANEGEPSGYGTGHVDPEGSVSIIAVPKGETRLRRLQDKDVRTASFAKYIGQEAALRSEGIRVYGPGSNAAQDFEPEYIAVSADSSKAYVTLQENNAIAEIDIESATVTHVRPLGYKDYSEAPRTVATYEWTNRPSIGSTAAGQKLFLGGFSGLFYEGVTGDGKLKFLTHTDRGPNGEPTGVNRPFLLPKFNPHLVRFTLDPTTGRFALTEQIALTNAQGKPLTGVSNIVRSSDGNLPHNDEVPVDLRGNVLPLDPLGGDFEGIAVAGDGSFWMADEYRPALYHFTSEGRLIERFVPIGTHAVAGAPVPAPGTAGLYGIEALPEAIAQRRQNRGMEAIAIQNGKIYAFVQSPIRNPVTLSNGALNAMQNVRLVEFDPATYATRQFLYVMDNPASTGAADTRADKIGDMTAVPGGGFLVVERDDDAVPEDPVETITKKVYSFNLATATEISALATFDVGGVQKTVDQMTAAELAAAGVTPLAKTLSVDLAQAGFAGVEKIEGLTLLGNGQLALINDNDFGVAGIVIDNTTGTFTLAPGYVPENPTLGIVAAQGLDASDRDSSVTIKSWPVFGMYEPDAIKSFKVNGQTYLITANEGDARDWPGLSEEARVGALSLDAAAFPDATALKNNAALGRLNVTKTLGDTDGDGDFDTLFTLGGRSFSIWTPEGTQVFDSGSDFERIVAAREPGFFNASNDDRTFDSRSDNKGPEPEAVTVGKIGGRSYAFVGLERQGGIMIYDVTTPWSPVFVDYVNNRDFSVQPFDAPAAKDLGPEGVIFISEEESPNGKPHVVVANEISGTVTVYEVTQQK